VKETVSDEAREDQWGVRSIVYEMISDNIVRSHKSKLYFVSSIIHIIQMFAFDRTLFTFT